VNIPVVYEDDWLLVLNKPAGLLTIPAPGKRKRSLLKILNDDLKDKGELYRLHPCHRLDRQTSGLIIFAKGKSVQKKMMQEFKKRRVKKVYLAYVDGRISNNHGLIRNSVCGRNAITRYKLVRRFKDFSVVKAEPLTGRRNQIRLHFKQIGHPIIGEDRFAFRKNFKIKAKRLCLHAQALRFQHPATGEFIYLKAELPDYLKRFLPSPCVQELGLQDRER